MGAQTRTNSEYAFEGMRPRPLAEKKESRVSGLFATDSSGQSKMKYNPEICRLIGEKMKPMTDQLHHEDLSRMLVTFHSPDWSPSEA